MNKHWYSIHHKIPKKYKNQLEYPEEINCDANTQLVKNTWHTHKHWKDGADTPAMTLMEDTKFNLSILKREFVSDLIAVFEKHFGHYYQIETHIQEELWKLFELESAFNSKKH